MGPPVAAGGGTYNDFVAALGPLLWMRCDETTSTAANDSSGNGYHGSISNPGSWPACTIAAVSGYGGLGTGFQADIGGRRVDSASNAALAVGASSSGAWTLVLWCAGHATVNQYLLSRNNDAAIVYQYNTNMVEFASVGYSGSDPYPSSGISLSSADTTTPHCIVYTYDNGTYKGFKDGAQIFSHTRSFGLPTSTTAWSLGSVSAGPNNFTKNWEFQVYDRALTPAEISDMYDLRDAA